MIKAKHQPKVAYANGSPTTAPLIWNEYCVIVIPQAGNFGLPRSASDVTPRSIEDATEETARMARRDADVTPRSIEDATEETARMARRDAVTSRVVLSSPSCSTMVLSLPQ